MLTWSNCLIFVGIEQRRYYINQDVHCCFFFLGSSFDLSLDRVVMVVIKVRLLQTCQHEAVKKESFWHAQMANP